MNVTGTKNVLGTLAAFMTMLENYPKLYAGDEYGGKDSSLTTISFMLDILKLLGITDEFLYKWLARLLSDEEDSGVKKGILAVIEEMVKAILLSYITGMYTCPIDPILPDSFLKTPYTDQGYDSAYPTGLGLTIPLADIDAFAHLQNCPTSEKGSVFYFDTRESGLVPSTVYRSTDFNAYLWYIINKGNGNHHSVWDNRAQHRLAFKQDETGVVREHFVDASCQNSPTRVIRGVGIKQEIIQCEFFEGGAGSLTELTVNSLNEGNCIKVWGVSDRYYHQGLTVGGNLQRLNKTVFQFNFDYIYSLKLFNSKTIIAQIINSMLGLTSALSGTLSLEMNILAKKVEKLVEKVIEEESSDNSDNADDGYFVFSDDDYNEIVNDATLRYNGKYETGNDTGELADIDIDAITTYISEIDTTTGESKENAIISALKNTTENLSGNIEIDASVSFGYSKNLILEFIKETMVQIAMQVLSPKVMLLFAINSHFLNDTQENVTSLVNWEDFFKRFWNVLRSCIRKISEIVMQELLDLVIGQLKPIVSLIVKKLMLETIYYYKVLLEELILACTPSPDFSLFETKNMEIANVNYADIIPVQTTPSTNDN